MPNGSTHAAVARPIAAGLALAGVGLALLHPPAVGLVFGGWAGQYVDPDLDLSTITQSERRIIRRNRFLGGAWVLYWLIYARTRPHRGISHTWPHGTIERFVLALWPLLALSALAVSVEPDALEPVAWWWLWVFVGLSIQDLAHIAMDALSTKMRRRRA